MGAKYYLQYVFVQIDQDYQELFVQRNEQSVMMVIIHNDELEEGSVKGKCGNNYKNIMVYTLVG